MTLECRFGYTLWEKGIPLHTGNPLPYKLDCAENLDGTNGFPR